MRKAIHDDYEQNLIAPVSSYVSLYRLSQGFFLDSDALMQIPSVASIIKLHRQSTGPLSFSPAALRALDALAPAMPGVSVAFDVDEGGDAYAIIHRRCGKFAALVIAGTAGRTNVVDHTGATVATLGNDEASIRRALRCEVESGGSLWQT